MSLAHLWIMLLAGLVQSPETTSSTLGTLRHPSKVCGIVCASDRAFTLRDDGWLVPYDLATKRPLPGIRLPGEGISLSINPSRTLLAATVAYSQVILLNAATLEVIRTAEITGGPAHVVFDDADHLIVSLLDGTLVQCSTADLGVAKRITPLAGSRVIALAASPDGARIAASTRDGEIAIFRSANLELDRKLPAFDQGATAIEFDASGKTLAAGDPDGQLKVWNMEDFSLIKEDKSLHQEAIRSISFLPSGKLVTGGLDGLCQFWNPPSYVDAESLPGYRGFILTMAVSADGKDLIRGGSSLDFVPIDHPEGFERVAEYGGAITAMAVGSDQPRLITGGLDQRILSWTWGDENTCCGIRVDSPIEAMALCNNGNSVGVVLADGTIGTYSIKDLRKELGWRAHEASVRACVGLGSHLVTADEVGIVRFWDGSGQKVHEFREEAGCRSITATGRLLAIGRMDGRTTVYEVDGEPRRLTITTGRPFSVTAVAILNGEEKLAIGYMDGAIELLEASSGKLIRQMNATESSVLCLREDAHRRLLVGFRNGEVHAFQTEQPTTENTLVFSGPLEASAIGCLPNRPDVLAITQGNSVYFQELGSSSK